MSLYSTQFPTGNYQGNGIYPNKVQGRGIFFRACDHETKTVTIKQGQVLKAYSFLETDSAGKSIAHGPISEGNIVTFAALTSGQTLIAGGITFTAGSGGATAAQLASIWALVNTGNTAAVASATILAAGFATTVGTFTSGTFAGWETEAYGTTAIIFNSTAPLTNATDLAFTGTGTAPTISKVEGSTTFNKISGVLCFDVDATAGDVVASAYIEASFWADALVWAVNPAVDTVIAADGITPVACTAYNTGCAGTSAASNLLKRKFVEGSEFESLGFTQDGEIY